MPRGCPSRTIPRESLGAGTVPKEGQTGEKNKTEARLALWQNVTWVTLLVGYAAYYICRSDLSVAAPLITSELGSAGIDKKAIGLVASSGVFAYAIGKVLNGVLGDFLGGRLLFLLGMAGSIVATLWFGLSTGLGVFMAAWFVNRFFQSSGWVGLVKVASQWFSAERYGTIMGILSQSFLFGDAAGRFVLGSFLSSGFSWRGIFFVAAATLSACLVATFFLLHPTPAALGLPTPAVNPGNVFGEKGAEETPQGIGDLLGPYLTRPSFWYVCALSLGLTLIREAFQAWTPLYLVEAFGIDQASAAQKSALFPFVGGLSVIVVGVLSDQGRGTNRMRVALPLLSLSALSLLLLGRLGPGAEGWGLVLISAAAFCLIGPYSLLAGAIAVDFGGKRGSATAAGLIDSAGYMGGVLSGYAVGAIAEAHGWGLAFLALAIVAAASTVVAFLYCWQDPFPREGRALESANAH